MRILLKMKLTKHPVTVDNVKVVEELYKLLEATRISCWAYYCFLIPRPRLKRALIYHLHHHFQQIFDLMSTFDDLLSSSGFKDEGEVKPWETLKILSSFLYMLRIDDWRNIAEHFAIPDMSEDLMRIRVTSAQFNEVWQSILDKLHERLVPYLALVEVFCGGNVGQICYGCSEEVIVSSVIGWGSGALP